MTDNLDNTIRDAFNNPPPTDTGRGEDLNRQVVGEYRRKLRFVERLAWAYLLILTWIALYGLLRFISTPSIKMALGFAMLVMVIIQMHSLIKLWYWVMNSKVGILRELKLMQLSLTAGKLADAIPPEPNEFSWRAAGCSRGERFAWILVLAAGGGIISGCFGAQRPEATQFARADLQANGTVETTIDTSHVWTNPWKNWYSYEAPADMDLRWYDRHGQPLFRELTISGDRAHYRIYPTEPVGMGEPVSIRQVSTGTLPAPDPQGIWTYSYEWRNGSNSVKYILTVQLPPGAELVSASPEPLSRTTREGRTVLELFARRAPDETVKSTVRYRLPTASTAPSVSQ